MSRDLLIVGRGPSVHRYDWSSVGMPVMAVSSGVFALPETVMPEHFVTLDEPKFFLDTLAEHVNFDWSQDEACRYWPFWREADIQKHVPSGRVRHGRYRVFPNATNLLDAIPEEHHHGFFNALAGKIHEFGFQPGWDDWPNVRGWQMDLKREPNFSENGILGLGGICNSLFFAVQVARHLGYDTLHFIGVDMNLPHYEHTRKELEKWAELASATGQTWINLAPESALAKWMKTVEVA